MLYPKFLMLSSAISFVVLSFGLIVGSFLNVCIFRLPRKVFWKGHRSQCFSCKSKIPFWLNIPVFSYCCILGRARCCNKKIPVRYPLVEALTACLFLLIYWRHPFVGWDIRHLEFYYFDCLRFSHIAIFSSLLLICSFIDFEFMIIPDEISLGMVGFAPLVCLLHPELSWTSSLYGVFLGAGIIYAIAWLYFIFRSREGIGMGDAKLLAAIGGWCGYQAVLPSLFYGSVIGSLSSLCYLIISRQFSFKAEIPFGPFLAAGALFHLLSPVHFISLFL
ncbi:MAG: prepilin peptidase [Zetaproteobacteria bacterium]|nr:prepilin peptidase [Pseudobdellovibrionaceae bacterium]